MKSCLTLLAVIAGLFIVASLAGVVIAGNLTSTTRVPDALDACITAHEFVEQTLKAPSTAKFPACHSSDVKIKQQEPLGRDVWTVTGYVDSQNSFGAMLRSTYIVKMIYDPARHTWHLQETTFLP